MCYLKRVSIVLFHFLWLSTFSQNTKEILSLNQCLKITKATLSITLSDGVSYYDVYVDNKCDRAVIFTVTSKGNNGAVVSPITKIRARRPSDKYPYIDRVSMTSSTGKFKLEAYKFDGEKETIAAKETVTSEKPDKEGLNKASLTKKYRPELKDFLDDSVDTNPKSSKSKDFLDDSDDIKPKSSKSKDFLDNSDDAVSKTNKSKDYLDDSISNEKDFLYDGDSDDKYQIVQREGGIQGVIDNKGNILIPFKKHRIESYEGGVARISIPFASKTFNSKLNSYFITANKTGYVDSSGEFLDGYEISFTENKSKLNSGAVLYLTKTGDNFDYEKQKALDKKRNGIAYEKTKSEINAWKNEIKTKYKK